MSQLPAPVRLDEEQRLELVQTAGRTERANRPRFLLLFGVLAIIAASVFVLVKLAGWSAAKARLSSEQETAATVVKLVGELQATRGTDIAVAGREVALSTLQAWATESGLSAVVGSEDNDARPQPAGFERKQMKFKISSQPAAAIFKWIARASQEEGLELSQVSLNPGTGTADGQPRWNADVTFLKWRRKS